MEINSEGNPLKDIAEGVSNSIINKVEQKIKNFVKKFNEGDLAFIQERETIDRVRSQLKNNEYKFYKNYIHDNETLRIVSFGLALKKLEEEKEDIRRINLNKKILYKFGKEKLHFAYSVQNKILSKYIIFLIENIETELIFDYIGSFIKDIEKHALFVKKEQDQKQVADTIKTKIIANSPPFFVVSGKGNAKEIVNEAVNSIINFLKEDYSIEEYKSERSQIFFFNNLLNKEE